MLRAQEGIKAKFRPPPEPRRPCLERAVDATTGKLIFATRNRSPAILRGTVLSPLQACPVKGKPDAVERNSQQVTEIDTASVKRRS